MAYNKKIKILVHEIDIHYINKTMHNKIPRFISNKIIFVLKAIVLKIYI